ncbi:uncharacterized protein UHOR_03944 [Ustilago hordei]|uniref:Uncharacterized protein n=1 Tax=Ustilago hordei TaxID=120017 RepID=I2G553_USTHO|nr:uncharacterized protein UHOR_03944 [Ustilago hordei]
MFVFLGFMWLLSGMTGLLWGYQKGRLPTLEEVLPYVRETASSWPYTSLASSCTAARIFGHQPQLTDSLDNHLSFFAQALTGDAPRLPGTNLTSADLHSPLSIFLPPFPASPSAQHEIERRLSFIVRIYPPSISRAANATALTYTIHFSPHLSIDLVAKRGSQLFRYLEEPCPFAGGMTVLIRDVVVHDSTRVKERLELIFDGLSSVGFYMPKVVNGQDDEREREEDAWAEAVRFNAMLDLGDCLRRYDMVSS